MNIPSSLFFVVFYAVSFFLLSVHETMTRTLAVRNKTTRNDSRGYPENRAIVTSEPLEERGLNVDVRRVTGATLFGNIRVLRRELTRGIVYFDVFKHRKFATDTIYRQAASLNSSDMEQLMQNSFINSFHSPLLTKKQTKAWKQNAYFSRPLPSVSLIGTLSFLSVFTWPSLLLIHFLHAFLILSIPGVEAASL